MSKRTEFSAKVKLDIFRRAGGPDKTRCECCGAIVVGRNFEIDHKVAEWILADIEAGYRGVLTAEDGWLLGTKCGCHKKKTAREAGERAKGKRIVAVAAKAKRRKGKPMPGSRDSKWKRTMDGRTVLR